MRLSISGLKELRERLERLRPEEIMARALAEQAERMAQAVRDDLSEPSGASDHDRPWLQSGALRDSVDAQTDGLQAVVGSSDPAAAPQEMGTAKMQPRPFLAPVAAGMGEDIARAIAARVAAALQGDRPDIYENAIVLGGNDLSDNALLHRGYASDKSASHLIKAAARVASEDFSYPRASNVITDTGYSTPGGIQYGRKIQRQIVKRGWTTQEIDDAVKNGERIDAVNKANGNPATRYVNPQTGRSVVIDNMTNEVLQVGGEGFTFGPSSGDRPGAVMRPPPAAGSPPTTPGSVPDMPEAPIPMLPDMPGVPELPIIIPEA